MAAQSASVATDPRIGSLDEAYAYVAAAALSPTPVGRVGLELEFHLVDLTSAARPMTWSELSAIRSMLPAMPAGSAVTTEPGGQIELSTPPAADVASAIAALSRDQQVLAASLDSVGLSLVPIGADPIRPARRLNPAARYVAMEAHFDALGCGSAGRAMMSSTAALQVNVEAGPRDGWAERLRRIHALGPVLVSLAACSPMMAGQTSGWRSMRQQVWGGIDQARCGPLPDGHDPADAWASYALAAPVMLVREPGHGTAATVSRRVRFADWVSGSAPLTRAPTFDDLDYHLSTLFPPARPRGFIEIRYLDAVPARWWPALAALTVTLLDDEVAADLAEAACQPVAGRWMDAARLGLGDPALASAAARCAEIAARRCAIELRAGVEAYAELVTRRRSPGDDLREAAMLRGPQAILEEAADV